MARNAPLLPRPRRGARRVREKQVPPMPDDLRTAYGWLTRLTADPTEAEQLLVEILRRSRTAAPDCLRAASDTTRLQYLTVESVLRRRGIL